MIGIAHDEEATMYTYAVSQKSGPELTIAAETVSEDKAGALQLSTGTGRNKRIVATVREWTSWREVPAVA